jgi:hypothetical protein
MEKFTGGHRRPDFHISRLRVPELNKNVEVTVLVVANGNLWAIIKQKNIYRQLSVTWRRCFCKKS